MVLEAAADLADRMGLPAVATSDVHYVLREDAEAQDVLLCVNTGKFRSDTNRMKMDSNEFYLRSPEEMYAAFPGREEALRRSQEIADQVSHRPRTWPAALSRLRLAGERRSPKIGCGNCAWKGCGSDTPRTRGDASMGSCRPR